MIIVYFIGKIDIDMLRVEIRNLDRTNKLKLPNKCSSNLFHSRLTPVEFLNDCEFTLFRKFDKIIFRFEENGRFPQMCTMLNFDLGFTTVEGREFSLDYGGKCLFGHNWFTVCIHDFSAVIYCSSLLSAGG